MGPPKYIEHVHVQILVDHVQILVDHVQNSLEPAALPERAKIAESLGGKNYATPPWRPSAKLARPLQQICKTIGFARFSLVEVSQNVGKIQVRMATGYQHDW